MIERVDEIKGVSRSAGVPASGQCSRASGPSFERVLSDAMHGQAPLRFSAHAQRRIQSRDIRLADSDLSKIGKAVDKAGEKGSRESLVLLDRLAFVVSVRNRVVITALGVPEIKDGVVTNIDSVVVA